MRIIFILALVLIFSNACGNKSRPNEIQLNKYPYLGEGVDSFFNDYYRYPDNLEEFILFLDKEPLFVTTNKILKKRKNNIKIIENEKVFILLDKNDSILKANKIDICSLFNKGHFNSHFLRNILFYKNGVLLSKKRKMKLENEIRNEIVFLKDKSIGFHEYNWQLVSFDGDLKYWCTRERKHIHPYEKQLKGILQKYVDQERIDSIKMVIPYGLKKE